MICDGALEERIATPDKPFHYTDSGLSDVHLAGITYYVCQSGHLFAKIPAIEELLSLIARDLTEKSDPLSGEEIRFLRKRLGEKAAVFAQAISVKPESLSRIENSHIPAGARVDKLVRYHYAIESGDPILVPKLRESIKDVVAKRKPKSSRVIAKLSPGKHWEANLAA
jgi:transcriptional regulator with XRE-family HTH domain